MAIAMLAAYASYANGKAPRACQNLTFYNVCEIPHGTTM
jgi:hypothetical protein